MMPHPAQAPHMDTPHGGGSRMHSTPTAATAAKAHATAYPVFNSRDVPSGFFEGGASHTPYHTSSPLCCPSHGGGGGGNGGGRAGCCYYSHTSTPSLYSGAVGPNSAAGQGTGGGHFASYTSNELQEYISMTSPSSDFYAYSPQPFYLEAPLPCAAAELYGSCGTTSPHATSFGPNGAPVLMSAPPLQAGLPGFCYGAEPTTPATASGAAPHTPSLMSSMSLSASRCPQWYLPRGLYNAPLATVMANMSSGVYNYAACTPTEDEDMLWEEAQRHALPPPPRLSPQLYGATPNYGAGSHALPPSVLGVANAPQSHGSSSGCGQRPISSAQLSTVAVSGDATPVSSPTFRPARPPQFLPFDGRAYGLPACRGGSGAVAAVAVTRSPLTAEFVGQAEAAAKSGNGYGGGGGALARRPREAEAVLRAITGRSDAQSVGAVPPAKSIPAAATAVPLVEREALSGAPPSATCAAPTQQRPRHSKTPTTTSTPASSSSPSGAAAKSEGQEEGGEVYSPQDRALLIDARIRLARLRAKAHEEQQRVRLATAPPASTPSSHHTSPLRTAGSGGSGAAAAAVRAAPSLSEDGELPISPIARLDASQDATTARLDDSADQEEITEEEEGEEEQEEVAADVDTRAVLEQVLSVRGVKWRHDPYSRRVLPNRPGHSSAEDDISDGEPGSGGSRYEHLTPPSDAEPASPNGRSVRAHEAGRKRSTSEPSAAAAAGTGTSTATTTLTQPPESASASLQSQGSGASSGGSLEGSRRQPSARRVPIKKVCVRHFVSSTLGGSGGGGDRPEMADSVVGTLLEVVTPPPTRHTDVSLNPTPTTSTATGNAVLPRGPLPRATEPVAESPEPVAESPEPVAESPAKTAAVPSSINEIASPHTTAFVDVPTATTTAATTTIASAVEVPSQKENYFVVRSPLVPPPRSKQVQLAASRDSSVLSQSETATAAAERTEGVTAAHGGASDITVKAGVRVPYTSWALQMRSPLVTVPANTAALSHVPSSAAKMSSTSLIDTRELIRMWHQLDSCGCFRDVLEARRRRLGAESNSFTRVVSRSVARRYGGRQGGAANEDDNDAASQHRLAMLTEDEVTHVYVLRHRHRSSCAVGTRRFECGAEVVVDGDMGVDTGVVTLSMTKAQYYGLSAHERRVAELAPQLECALSSSVHRTMLPEEVLMRTSVQMPLEDATLEFLQFLCTQPQLFHSCRIDCMEFVRVEFQADGQKLYVYYQTSCPVRFLELATYLNHIFHCRVWMKLAKGV